MRCIAGPLAGALLILAFSPFSGYVAEGEDGIPVSLTGRPGDPVNGRKLVVTRQLGLCLLCHSGPFPEERFQGTIGPDLSGVGSRLSEGQLRLRLVAPAKVNPETVMPAYHATDGLNRVGPAWQGRPILSAEQIEDIVTFLRTLKDG
jgi:sulfur-oxidizing protein SoxX